MAREQTSNLWSLSRGDSSIGLPETTLLDLKTTFPKRGGDQFANVNSSSAQSMYTWPSGAIASSLDVWNGITTQCQAPMAQPILTTALLKADYTCMTSDHILSLLDSIWEYSFMYAFLPTTPIEVAAGHRYWLPNDLLAEEWMMLFTFVPRLLDSAPPEVITAFDEQVYNVVGDWPSFVEIMQKEDCYSMPRDRYPFTQLATQPFSHGVHVFNPNERTHFAVSSPQRSLENPRTSCITVAEGHSGTIDFDVDYPQSEGALSADQETAKLITGPLPVPSSKPDHLRSFQSSAAPANIAIQSSLFPTGVVPRLLPHVQSDQHISQGHMQLAFALATRLHPSTSSVLSVPVFPLQSIPSGTAAFEQNPAAPPIFDQLLQARGITVPGFRPGSVLPNDNGNKAWGAERIRAFVEIQHNSIHQLPPTAFSPLGTEMSNFRTPESIDVTCCPFETSLEENFTYLSNVCTLNREMCVRAREHWLPMHIARYINYAHDIQTRGIFGRSKVGHHFAKAKMWGEARPGHVPTASLRNTSPDSGARGPNRIPHDYFLHSMGDGVVRPPHRHKAQMLTRVIQHVRNVTGDRNVRLSEAATYAQKWNITVPAHEQMDFQNLAVEDRLPSAAFLSMIKDDYRTKFGGEDP
ncbi:hypothetical protein G6011_00294 [Alternaria panax]|uniref:Uncharacterized protein n=1 Tax=Alternaria panax TaxID=48097 RepID=A0AAD4NUX5_9PLEO|nr:hypothetical protein G6011_00294 [Alternaria panax]